MLTDSNSSNTNTNKQQEYNADQFPNFNQNTRNTEVLYGIDNVMNTELQFFSKTRGRIDTCMNYTTTGILLSATSQTQ